MSSDPPMGNDGRAVLNPFQSRLAGISASRDGGFAPLWPVGLLRGRDHIAAMRPMLLELSRRTGQTGAMESLEHLLGEPTMLGKAPYVVLVGLRPGVAAGSASADDLHGAVVLHEYQVAGLGTRLFATHDFTGQRTVFAPAEIRAQVAEAAGHALAGQGAWMTLITVETEAGSTTRPPLTDTVAIRTAMRTRTVPRDLLMSPTLEETLASLGKRTRRNLRYYRRRAEADLGAVFISPVTIDREQFLAMNRASTNPATDADAAWRFSCLDELSGSMLMGVQSADGHWLSLLGGRRRDGVTGIEWQMNRAGLARYSLSTVMRSYLLEHEVALGTTRLMFQGGTPHSMRHSLAGSDVLDILVVRKSPVAWLLRCLVRWIFPKSNFLGRVLRDEDLVWTD